MRRQRTTKKYRGYFAILLCLLLTVTMNFFTLTSVWGESTAGTEQGLDASDEGARTDELTDGETTELRTTRVAFPVQEGMSYYREDGTPDGYNYTYMEKVGEYTGWQIEYVPFDTGDLNENVMEAMNALEDGDVDIFGPLLKNSATEQLYDFPEKSYGIVYTTLCALESSSIREDNASAQELLRVGLMKGADTRNSEVISYLETGNYNYKVFYYESATEQYQALVDDKVDVISSVSLSLFEGTRIIEKFAPRPYYLAVKKGNTQLAEELDKTIGIIDQVQPTLQDTLFERYFRNARYNFSLTDEQKEYLLSMGKIKALCVDYDAPYVYLREGNPAGLLVSVLNEFAQEAGISVEYTFCEDQEEAESKLEEEHYDIMMGMPFTSRYCVKIGFVRSKSVVESTLAYLHDSSSSSHEAVAVENGLENFIDSSEFDEIINCKNAKECVDAVSSGKAAYAVGDRSAMEYYIYDTYSSMVTSNITGATQQICFAINKDSDMEFIQLLNDYIYCLTDLQKTAFLESGNTHVHRANLRNYIRIHPAEAMAFFSLLTALLVIAVAVLLHARKMAKKNEELQIATMAKTEFLTRMSHDIRTPMNGIIGMLNIADKCADDPKAVKEYHQKIRAASEYLLSLINDILDMSKLDSDEIVLTEDSVYLGNILKNCRDIMETRAAEHGIELLTPELESFKPPRVFASELHVRQILVNLISNAIKYNKPNGKIICSANLVEQKADTVTCRFVVEDTGIGMSEEFQKHMFEPFSQEHGENRSEFKGTGLGLSIVKKLVDKMNGEIRVESRLGEGTKFTILLPFRIDKNYQKPEKKLHAEEISLEGKHILAAEDNELNAEILEFMLLDLGVKADIVNNGKQAVEAFEKSEPGYYDCILMDVMMPVMDGYTACREIREMGRTDSHRIPIIALTANAFAEDVAKSERAGMNAHITKPIDVEKLKICMARLMEE